MKLVVMIPAYNEEDTISRVISSIPRQVSGFDSVQVIVLDDGSQDRTCQVSREAGADQVYTNVHNLGLASNFQKGLDKALSLGADVVVNIDADNQYDASEIPKLTQPILDGESHIVNGDRQVASLDHMSWSKKYGNRLGTWIVQRLAGFRVRDASSGYRAYSREAALRLNVLSSHTYTHETILQAGVKHLGFKDVSVSFRATERDGKQSRLIGSVWSHIKKSGNTIIRTFTMYRSLKTFFNIGVPFFLIGIILIVRFLYFYYTGDGSGHIQSLIIATIVSVIGFQIVVIGLLADSVNANRRISEEVLYRLKKQECDSEKTE
ncbi:MAG: glycosyltransferase family 2 protein [bacterium]